LNKINDSRKDISPVSWNAIEIIVQAKKSHRVQKFDNNDIFIKA